MYPQSTVCITGNELLDKAPTAMQPSLGDAELLLQYNFILLNNKFLWIILDSLQPPPAAVIKAGIAWGRKMAPCTSPREQLCLVLWHTTPQRWQPTELFIFQSLHQLPKMTELISSLLFVLFEWRESQACLAAERVMKWALCRVPAASGLLYGAVGERAPKSNRKQYNPV